MSINKILVLLLQGFYAVLGFFQFFCYVQRFGCRIRNAAADLQELKARNAVLYLFDDILQACTAELGD